MSSGEKMTSGEGLGGRPASSGGPRATGAALERAYQFMVWLVPTLEKFPRSQRFLLGDRIEGAALDLLAVLVEATYQRSPSEQLRRANLLLEQLRLWIRLAHDLRHLDARRYEFAVRSLNEVGKRVGAWIRAQHAASPS